VHVPKDFLWALSRAGIDPDMLQWCIEEQFEEGILQKLKRSVAIKKELRVASHRIEQLRSTINLFSGMDTSLFAVEPDPSGCIHLQGFRFCENEGFVEFPASLGISFSLSSTLSQGKVSLQKALENKGLPVGTRIVGNLPYRFHCSSLPSSETLLLLYGINLAKNCAEVGQVQEQDWWRMVVSALNRLHEQWRKGSPRSFDFESLEPLFTQELPLNETKVVFPYVIWNLETLFRIIDPSAASRGNGWERLRKKVKHSIQYQLPEDREGCIPLVGDFWVLSNGVYLLYQIEGRLTPLKLLQANKSIENIEKLRTSLEGEALYVQERERLLRFLERLHQVPPKRVKKATTTQQAAQQISESQLPNRQISQPQSIQPSTEAQKLSKSTGPLATPSDLPFKGSPLSMPSSGSGIEPIGTASKGRASILTGLSKRSWSIYLLGGLFLTGLIVALWQFDLFPSGLGRSGQPAKTHDERSLSPDSTSNAYSTVTAEGPIAKPEVPSKAGESSEGQKDVKAQREAQVGKDQGDARLQGTEAQKDAKGQKEGDTLPSTYTANIPPLGDIPITVLDVFYLVNEIADANGYRRLDSPKDLRPDPNWIYPGNQFKLPDSSVYLVKRGDTLWGITTRYIEQEVAKGLGILKSYLGPRLESKVPQDKKSELEGIIGRLQKESHCKAFVEFLERKKKEVVYR